MASYYKFTRTFLIRSEEGDALIKDVAIDLAEDDDITLVEAARDLSLHYDVGNDPSGGGLKIVEHSNQIILTPKQYWDRETGGK
jgi:hypothetical protein